MCQTPPEKPPTFLSIVPAVGLGSANDKYAVVSGSTTQIRTEAIFGIYRVSEGGGTSLNNKHSNLVCLGHNVLYVGGGGNPTMLCINRVTADKMKHTPSEWVERCRGPCHAAGGRAGPQLDQQVPTARSQRLGAVGQSCGPDAGHIPPDSRSHLLVWVWSQTAPLIYV